MTETTDATANGGPQLCPRPFCHGRGVVTPAHGLPQCFRVHCDQCQLSGPSVTGQQFAIAEWNQLEHARRHPSHLAESRYRRLLTLITPMQVGETPASWIDRAVGKLMETDRDIFGIGRNVDTPNAPKAFRPYGLQFTVTCDRGFSTDYWTPDALTDETIEVREVGGTREATFQRQGGIWAIAYDDTGFAALVPHEQLVTDFLNMHVGGGS